MVRKGQRTGLFDLHDVDAIEVDPLTIQTEQKISYSLDWYVYRLVLSGGLFSCKRAK